MVQDLSLRFHPLTPNRWGDFERLFGANGACGGCWCMWWRLPRSEFDRNKGDANRQAMKQLVEQDMQLGILAYSSDEPVGWCAIAPRQDYPALGRSRILRPVDEQPVWSITCFFIHKKHRNKGLSTALIREAVRQAAEHGARIIEGYPVEPKKTPMPAAFAWTGLASAFLNAGFKEVARRSETRPMMRYMVS